MLFVCYDKCGTCKKAEKYLLDKGYTLEKRDIKTEKPSLEELTAWYKASGLPLKRFYNTSGKLYKELNLKDKIWLAMVCSLSVPFLLRARMYS